MLFIIAACGSVPALYFRSNRESPSARAVWTILAATVSGAPTQSAPSGPGFAFELRARHGRPAALAADAGDHRLVVRPELVPRLLVGRRNVAWRVHRDGQLGLAELLQRLAVEIHERAKAHRAAADDRERQGRP